MRFFRYSPAVDKRLMIKARKLSKLNPRILIQSTWIITGVRRCRIKDLLVIKSIQKKWCKHVNTNFSFSSRLLANNFFLQGLYIFLFWRDWSFSRKPLKREACSRAKISGVVSHLWIFMSRLWRRSVNLNKVIFFNTQKLADRKSNRQRVSVWTDSSTFLNHVFRSKRSCKITNVVTEARGCLAQTWNK